MYVDLQRFMYYVDLAFPNYDKTILSNIKVGRRAIPNDIIVGTLNYMVDRPCSYLVPQFYQFALDFNFRRLNNLNCKCFKYMDELKRELEEE